MKYSALIIIPVLFAFGCGDDVEKLSTVNKDITLQEAVAVSIPEGSSMTYTETKILNLEDEIRDLSSKLDKVEITDMSMTITEYSSSVDPVTLENATLSFVGTTVAFGISNPIDLSLGDVIITLDASAEILELLQAKLLDDKKLTVDMVATVDNVPVNFTVTVEVKVRVTGSLL
jgi:hypothetical protein